MASAPDRVVVWAAQLAANDFPPVCAMTGRPAATSHKFVFGGPLDWLAAVLVIIGLRFPGWRPRLATGQLPLTDSSRQKVMLVETPTRSLPVLAIMLEMGGIALARSTSDPDLSAIARTLITLGVVVALIFVPALLVSSLVPHGKVLDPPVGYSERMIELRAVHPAFVAAVNQMHAARATHDASMQTGTGVPTLSEST